MDQEDISILLRVGMLLRRLKKSEQSVALVFRLFGLGASVLIRLYPSRSSSPGRVPVFTSHFFAAQYESDAGAHHECFLS